jgi:Mg2+ and Co2+ transporter CorA
MHSLLPPAWSLPDAIAGRLGEGAGRQRAMHHDDHLLLVAHEPPRPSDHERRARLFWRRPDGHWESSANGSGGAALHRLLEEYAARIDALEDRLQTADDADDYHTVLHEGTPLHRAVRNLHKALQAAREAVKADRELLVVRDRANDLERAAELLLSDAQVGLAYTTAKRSEEAARSGEALSRAGHRINLLAATFLPLTAIASVFGMQMQHGLETRWAPWPFWIVLTIGLGVGFLLRGLIGRRRGPDSPA